MIRCGIGLYGYGNQEEVSKLLRPVGVLKTIISQIHYVKTGDAVGYNRGFVANKPIRSATLPIGHADGIGRLYGKAQRSSYDSWSKSTHFGECMHGYDYG